MAYVIRKYWKRPKCHYTVEWLNKLEYIHTMEYNAAVKKKGTLQIYSNIQDIVSEKGQNTKKKCVRFQKGN